ncbi:unnamed protein product [Paramecium pentaurelia]|uniref:Uncharacterized protein n=1 Tax=Paramecium pentaurelia TaxID=43138 RepID=A0A8S1Y7L8_9CILI|nr:unnamed protein product [Paramecium pentaurelia]
MKLRTRNLLRTHNQFVSLNIHYSVLFTDTFETNIFKIKRPQLRTNIINFQI